jgi:hypothetical protein
MAAKRKTFRSNEFMRGNLQEKAVAFESVISYSGVFRLDHGEIIHTVKASAYPNWVGTRQLRRATLRGKRLTLTTRPYVGDGQRMIARLVWARYLE